MAKFLVQSQQRPPWPDKIKHACMSAGWPIVAGWAYLRQHEWLFSPVRAPWHSEPTATSWTWTGDRNASLKGWVLNPERKNALIYWGGKGEQVLDRLKAFDRHFQDHACYILPYRGFWPNRGKPTEWGVKSDALHAYDNIAHRHESVSLIGRSLGTGVALHVATCRNVGRLALITPYESLAGLAQMRYPFLPVDKLLQHRFDAWKDVSKVSSSVLALLAEVDDITPHEGWHRMKKNFAGLVHECAVEGVNHESILSKSRTWNHIKEFLNHPLPHSSLIKDGEGNRFTPV